MQVGYRVVRGPDWIWGDQDGGEGNLGTVVHLGGDGNLPENTVLVYWDNGKQANYRVGYSGKFDLRVYDSAQIGLKHTCVTCDGCGQRPLLGTRWKCGDCDNYDLCLSCYMGDIHDKGHSFLRFDFPGAAEGIPVDKRLNSTIIQSRGMFPGAKVARGRDWQWADQDSGSGGGGTLSQITSWKSVARAGAKVSWNLFKSNTYRLGHEGKVDLICVTPATGPAYYRESLPVLGATRRPKPDSSQVKVGDRVTIALDLEILKAMSEGHGGWHDGMAQCIGRIGEVEDVDERGDVHVRFGIVRWMFHPGAITKLADHSQFRAGSRVKVLQDKQIVQQLQQGHGGWNDSMTAALGKEGKVMEVDADGDVVAMVGTQIWLFNPAVLQLLSPGDGEPKSPVRDASPLDQLMRMLLLEVGSKTRDVGDVIVNAASTGNLQEVKQLLDKNPDKINHKRAGKTALHVACHQGKSEVVKFLLSRNANKDIKDDQDYTALHHAAYGDKTGKTVTIMLGTGANVNVNSNKNNSTPLHLAVSQGNEAAVRELVKSQHCDLNCQDVAKDTPLHEAICKDKHGIVDILLGAGPQRLDVSTCNKRGFNALHLACMKGNKRAVEKMVDKHPELIEIPKDDGFTALHLAVFNNNPEIARTLLLSGQCDINMRNNRGQTALALAVSEAHTDTIELLIEHGADVNAEDEDGDTPLHLAVIHQAVGTTGIRRLFQEMGINLPGSESERNTGSAIACYLALHGADINYMNHEGKTPLVLCPDPQTALNIQHFWRTTTRRSTPQPRPREVRSESRPRPPPPPGSSSATARAGLPGTAAASKKPTTGTPQKWSQDSVNRAETAASDCIICSENSTTVTFHPCGHKICCAGCSIKIKRCLLCNTVIEKKISTEGASFKAPTMMDVTDYQERMQVLQARLREMEDVTQCSICMDRLKSVVFLCGHGACTQCSEKLRLCHVCRQTITNRIPLYN